MGENEDIKINDFKYSNEEAFKELMRSNQWIKVNNKKTANKIHRIVSHPQRRALRRAYNNGK